MTAANATAPSPRRRFSRRLGLVLLGVLLALVGTLGWLLGTTGGLRFTLARVQGITDGALTVRQAQGRLLGPLQLEGLRYADGHGTEVTAGHVMLDLRFWPLLAWRLHVRTLDLEAVRIALPKAGGQSTAGGGFSLKPPLDLLIDRAHVGKLAISQDGRPVFASDSLDLAGRWTSAGIVLTQLALRAPDGRADLDGQLVFGRRYRGDGKGAFAWRAGGVDYAGRLSAHSDGRHSHAALRLTAPAAVQVELELDNASATWTASLKAPRFDPKPLLGDSAPTALALDLHGRGDRHGGSLEGRLMLDDYAVLLAPVRAHFSDDFNTMQLDALTLTSPQLKGRVTASGTLRLDAQPLAGALTVDWQDLRLPAELAGQALASHGRLVTRGSVRQFHAEGDLALGPPGQLAQLALDLDGTPQRLALNTLTLKQPQGRLEARGSLVLQPALAWQLEARAERFDPGQLFAGWRGALDADLASHGTLAGHQPDATLELRKLSGRLRERPLRGSGTLHLSPARLLDGHLELGSGGSTVTLDAKPAGGVNRAELTLAVTSLGDWLPDAEGRVDGQFRLRGRWPRLSVDGHLDGRAMAWQAQRLDGVQLSMQVPDISSPGGRLDLVSHGLHTAGLRFGRITLHADGTAAKHALRLDAQGSQLSVGLALGGSLKGGSWRGTLSTLNLAPQGLPSWRLRSPAQLAWKDGAASLSELCLGAGEPLLCVAGKQDKAGNLEADYRLRALPLALLLDASGNAGLPLRVDGVLQGDGHLRRSAAGVLDGNATLTSSEGALTYTERADHPALGWRNFALDARFGPGRQDATVRAELDQDGRLDGRIGVSGAAQALDGELAVHLGSLAPLELATAELANVQGRLDGTFRFGGTLDRPQVSGQANVTGFAAELPAAGVKLGEGQLALSTRDAQQFQLDGSVRSGKGRLEVGGSVGLGAGATTAITLKGSQFTAADIPSAKVVISPDLTVRQDANGIDVSGSVTLDSADVNVEKLPGAGSAKVSPDVVVVDRPPERAAAALPLHAQVRVDLGPRTHLIGFGLNGRLGGSLTVTERPGRATTGRGQLAVSGTYRAYGQDLTIERGQLLFASTPIDNPGLNIRAVRKLNPNATIDEGQEVGLLVSGTARRPVLTVFSSPVMEQSDALSYLVTGKPLSQVKGGEGSMVGAAAQALGSAAGDLLAKSVGSKIGVDEIGVSSNAALGGGSAFTVGKYLSPRLYLSYGVGLFEPGEVITLRYRLSQRWNFEAQSATEFNRASLNYRIER
jgi:translocation and assembly module TamB